jgi:hypothetical protein
MLGRSREHPVGEQSDSTGCSYSEHDVPDHEAVLVADDLNRKRREDAGGVRQRAER